MTLQLFIRLLMLIDSIVIQASLKCLYAYRSIGSIIIDVNEWMKQIYTTANDCTSVRLNAHSEAHILSNAFIQSSMCWSIANKSVLNRTTSKKNSTNCLSIEINMPTMQCSHANTVFDCKQSIRQVAFYTNDVKDDHHCSACKIALNSIFGNSSFEQFWFFQLKFHNFSMNFGVVETHDFQLKQNEKKMYSIHGVWLGVNHVKWLFNNSIITILNWSRMVM